MSDDAPVLLDPFGQPLKSSAQMREGRTRQVTPGLRQWFKAFAPFLKKYELVLHCGVCRANLLAFDAWRHWGECPGYRPPLDGSAGKIIVKTPDGVAYIGAKPPERVEMPAKHIEWLRQFQDVGPHFEFGMHCRRCEADVMGKNSDTDKVFTASCGCRDFVGLNRDYREPTTAEGFYEAYGKP